MCKCSLHRYDVDLKTKVIWYLKGLSHELDWTLDDMDSSRPE
jgi:hypothetical protein